VPKLSALIHTHNNENTLGRTLESLRCVDEIVIVDDRSSDKTLRIAKQYGARIIPAVAGVNRGAYAVDCKYDWIFCLLPTETPSEGLEASIFEWKRGEADEIPGLIMKVRVQNGDHWVEKGPEMRIADRNKINWQDLFPSVSGDPPLLAGDLLRFND
jgi:glycosyltransferase involved in cell wall biosynthesis